MSVALKYGCCSRKRFQSVVELMNVSLSLLTNLYLLANLYRQIRNYHRFIFCTNDNTRSNVIIPYIFTSIFVLYHSVLYIVDISFFNFLRLKDIWTKLKIRTTKIKKHTFVILSNGYSLHLHRFTLDQSLFHDCIYVRVLI